MNLYFIQYNNYFNRIIKKKDTLVEYIQEVVDNYECKNNVDFDTKDGVTTEQVVNWNKNFTPDYLLVVKRTQEAGQDPVDTIISRWFILDWNWIRKDQYKATLKRDTIADNYEAVINAPCYIEKATIGPNDIAIYNQEPITFNEIKKNEYSLKDSTDVPWIVGYCAFNTPTLKNEEVASIAINTYGEYEDLTAFYEAIDYDLDSGWRRIDSWDTFAYYVKFWPNTSGITNYINFNYLDDIITYNTAYSTCPINIRGVGTTTSARNAMAESFASTVRNYHNSLLVDINNETLFNVKPDLENAYVKIGNSYKKVTFTYGTADDDVYTIHDQTLTNYSNMLNAAYLNYEYDSSTGLDLPIILTDYSYTPITVTLSDVTITGSKFNLTQSSRKLQDAPYKMFAIPAGEVTVDIAGSSYTTMSKEEAINVGIAIAKRMGSFLYDLQLLPYCPFNGIKSTTTGHINISASRVVNRDYNIITNIQGTSNKGIIVYPPTSTFTFNINKTLGVTNTALAKKIANQCDKYRLVSPNYAASFDFNIVKTGNIHYINVDCTYKPYNPYIHINPVWAKLYGEDYNDARGLICQGDFSIPIVNDQWQQYQINNKNYLNAFNREVESIELQNKYAKQQDIAGAIAGTLTGGTQGASTGNNLIGLTGSKVGAAVGTVASAAAGIADVNINEKLRNESLDLKKDLFSYNLQNIQAMPNTLAKVSSFDANNKLVPILEYYSCEEDEKEIFTDYLTYSGMTVNRVGTINEFKLNDISFIKGQIIRLNNFTDNVPVANDIYKEIYKGVFI